jgi:iron(III) transport system ATP-binding protein
MTPQPSTPAFQIDCITKRFDHFVALDHVSLTVNAGELLCFLGPSGCGKTTLLRIIAGLETQTQGRLVQGEKDVSTVPASGRDYGIVFQSYALFPNLTAAQNIGYGLVSQGKSKAEIAKRVDELLTLINLPGSGNKFPSQLSGGQQQRIALARALAPAPSLLLLDEPLSALDAIERVRLRSEIRRLQRQLGVTTIMVTHDQEEALAIADRVVVMNHGRIEQVGTPHEVYQHPASPFVADFIGKVNVLDATLLANGRYQVGGFELEAAGNLQPSVGASDATGTEVKLYLRPEDFTARNVGVDQANVVTATLSKVEYLGSFCLAEASIQEFGGRSLQLQFWPSYFSELGLDETGPLRIRLLSDRIRCFAS